MEMRRRVRNRIDVITVRYVIDVSRCVGDEHAPRVDTSVSRMRHQMPVGRRMRHCIDVISVAYVIKVRSGMRYRIVVRFSDEYLRRSGLGSTENSENHQTP